MLNEIWIWIFEDRSTLCHFHLEGPEQFLWFGSMYCPAGQTNVIGVCPCNGGCTLSLSMFEQMVWVKWLPHECQDPGISSRILTLEMFNVMYFNWAVIFILWLVILCGDITV